MYFKPLLIPLLVQVAITFVVMVIMYRKRVTEMKSKRIHPQRAKSRSAAHGIWPDSETASDNYANLFETPVLFYVAILLALILMLQDSIIVILSWTYVMSRFIHSFIHITYNRVMHRFGVFIFSSLVLFAIWIRLAWIIFQS